MTDQNETEPTPPDATASAEPEPTPEPTPEPEPTPDPEVVADASGGEEDGAAAEDAPPDPPAEPALTKDEVIAQGEARTKQMCDDYMAVRKPSQESAQDEQPE